MCWDLGFCRDFKRGFRLKLDEILALNLSLNFTQKFRANFRNFSRIKIPNFTLNLVQISSLNFANLNQNFKQISHEILMLKFKKIYANLRNFLR